MSTCLQGTLKVGRYNTFEGFVSSESVGSDILISGRVEMNRALDGDAVVVELLPEDQWRTPARSLPTGAAANPDAAAAEGDDGDAEGCHIAEVTSHLLEILAYTDHWHLRSEPYGSRYVLTQHIHGRCSRLESCVWCSALCMFCNCLARWMGSNCDVHEIPSFMG